jgi:hypothetical protein
VKKLILSVILIIISSNIFAANRPGRLRFEFNYGNVTTEYTESQLTNLFDNVEVIQKSEMLDLMFQYFLVPPYIDLTFGIQSAGSKVKSLEGHAKSFRYLNGYLNAGWVMPSFNDFWSLRMIFEGYFTTILVDGEEYGFKNLWGGQIYPEIEYLPFGTDLYTQVSPFFKFPLYTRDDQRKETTIGLKIKIPLGSERTARFPLYAYQKAIILRVFYSKVELKFQRTGFVPSYINVNQIGVTLGFNW